MLFRVLCVLGALFSLTAPGCRYILARDGSYSELRTHAERLDDEFDALRADLNDIVFGLERKPEEPVWTIYRE